MYKLFISTEAVPRSLNKKLRSNRYANHSENKKWDMIIYSECSSKLPKEPLKKAKVSINRYSYRMLDFDGLVGALKPVIDAFVSCGVLSDDSWNVLGAWDVHQVFRPKKDGPLLEILIQEMPSSSDQ
jgi:hypothetical protein